MIIFDLICCLEHKFEGWFQSTEDFDLQLSQEIISCPHCGLSDVRRVPSAAHLPKNNSSQAIQARKHDARPVRILALLEQMRSSIIANSENVGSEFANEARRIHYYESPARAIRGEATSDEFESLLDEGIRVMMLPIPKKNDVN